MGAHLHQQALVRGAELVRIVESEDPTEAFEPVDDAEEAIVVGRARRRQLERRLEQGEQMLLGCDANGNDRRSGRAVLDDPPHQRRLADPTGALDDQDSYRATLALDAAALLAASKERRRRTLQPMGVAHRAGSHAAATRSWARPKSRVMAARLND